MGKDFLTVKERSKLMSKIKSENTKPEIKMASLLDSNGIKYERYVKGLPGKPDFLVKGRRLVVFVDGSFWHGRKFKKWCHKLKPFWYQKISRNMIRDKRTNRKLRNMGFSVVHIWEEDVGLKGMSKISRKLRLLA